MKLIDKVKIIDIDKIYPYTNNPKEHPEKQINKIASSIKNFGFTVPIIIDHQNEIIAGHGRYKAAQKLELDKIPCIVRDDLNEAQVKALRLADNKVTESEWDEELLTLELEDLDMQDFDLELTGFENEEIEELFDSELESEEDNFNLEDELDNDNIVSKSGDIIKLGKHRLMCGDSTQEKDVNKLMNGEKADMVFTDPPYGVNYKNNMSDKFEVLENDDLFLDVLPILKQFSKNNIHWYIWTSHQVYPTWRDMYDEYYKNTIIWSKGGGGLGDLEGNYATDYEMCLFCHYGRKELLGTREGAVWDIKKDGGATYSHPTQKPIGLAYKALKNSSVQKDIVLDLFGGSGSTLIASEQLNRICYMMELDEKYVDVIIRRYINYRLDNNKEVNIKVNGEEVEYNKYLNDIA